MQSPSGDQPSPAFTYLTWEGPNLVYTSILGLCLALPVKGFQSEAPQFSLSQIHQTKTRNTKEQNAHADREDRHAQTYGGHISFTHLIKPEERDERTSSPSLESELAITSDFL